MWGAVIGDIQGSMYEWHPIKTKEFPLFEHRCKYTDDTVCTAAVADILLGSLPPAAALKRWCHRHPHRGYGGLFRTWLHSPKLEPYGSYGNGAAMRTSPAAYLNRNRPIESALEASDMIAGITHDHPEGVKGARATVHAIWLAFQEAEPATIRRTVEEEYGYDLTQSVDEIRPDYVFHETCQETVPPAITCALESVSFEDAIRNAISLGGDADTLAAIAGPIAEALHGIPDNFRETAVDEFLAGAPDIVDAMERMYRSPT